MAHYPDRHSRGDPGAGRRPARCTAGARPRRSDQVAAVMQRHARLPGRPSPPSTTCSHRAGRPPLRLRVHERLLPPARTRDALLRRDLGGGGRDRASRTCEMREFECLGACDMAPMVSVDGRYVGPIADEEIDTLRSRSATAPSRSRPSAAAPPIGRHPTQPARGAARPRRRPPLSEPAPGRRDRPCARARASLPIGEPPTPRAGTNRRDQPHPASRDIDEPGLQHARRLRAPRRLRRRCARR